MALTVQQQRGSWIYIVPVSGLILTDSVENEITINKVTFMTVDKLSRVRKRFGIRKKISELKTKEPYNHFFSKNTGTVAIVKYGGIPEKISTKVIRLITDELEMLSVSQLGYSKRRYNSHPSIHMGSVSRLSFLCLSASNNSGFSRNTITGKIDDLVLDDSWVNFQEDALFLILLKIIQNKIVVSSSWRDNLVRVSRLIGKSLTSNDLSQAFLLNMIAIESLLTRQGDKYTEILPKRIEAFIGWVGYWNINNYESEIKSIYKKRCKYVHDGNDKNIEIKDLLFTDDLLYNILLNLMFHWKIFKSKEDIIEFTKKVMAEHVLGINGIKSKIRPKTLLFRSKLYTIDDYEKI